MSCILFWMSFSSNNFIFLFTSPPLILYNYYNIHYFRFHIIYFSKISIHNNSILGMGEVVCVNCLRFSLCKYVTPLINWPFKSMNFWTVIRVKVLHKCFSLLDILLFCFKGTLVIAFAFTSSFSLISDPTVAPQAICQPNWCDFRVHPLRARLRVDGHPSPMYPSSMHVWWDLIRLKHVMLLWCSLTSVVKSCENFFVKEQNDFY